MTDHDGTTHFCGRCGGIGGTIVDEQDRISTPPHFGDDARDHAGLIVGGDYNPDTLARVGLHGSPSDKQESAKNKTSTYNEPHRLVPRRRMHQAMVLRRRLAQRKYRPGITA